MNGLRTMAVCVAVAAALAGCGSGSGDAAGGGGGGGAAGSGGSGGAAGSGGTTSDAPATTPDQCGGGPYVNVTGELSSYVSATTKIAGATITSDSCPGFSVTTDSGGKLAAKITKGMKYYPRITAPGYLTSRTGEQMLVADFDATAPLLPDSLTSILPHWSATAPLIVAVASPQNEADAGDPCSLADGVTFSVKDHPEATVVYYSGTALPSPDTSLAATGPLGVAEISGLSATAPGETVQLVAAKAGCTLGFASYPHTGQYVLEDGVLTLAGAFMPPVPTP